MMLRYLAKRVAGLVVVLLLMSFIVFCLQSIIPADPARAKARLEAREDPEASDQDQ